MHQRPADRQLALSTIVLTALPMQYRDPEQLFLHLSRDPALRPQALASS